MRCSASTASLLRMVTQVTGHGSESHLCNHMLPRRCKTFQLLGRRAGTAEMQVDTSPALHKGRTQIIVVIAEQEAAVPRGVKALH